VPNPCVAHEYVYVALAQITINYSFYSLKTINALCKGTLWTLYRVLNNQQ
jgi:hypothetical protein